MGNPNDPKIGWGTFLGGIGTLLTGVAAIAALFNNTAMDMSKDPVTLASKAPDSVLHKAPERSLTFECSIDSASNYWTTFAVSETRGKIRLISWESLEGDSSPEKKCTETTSKLQAAYDGDLNTLYIGNINGSNVICAVKDFLPTDCDDENVLFTLPEGVEPRRALEQLFNAEGLASGPLRL